MLKRYTSRRAGLYITFLKKRNRDQPLTKDISAWERDKVQDLEKRLSETEALLSSREDP